MYHLNKSAKISIGHEHLKQIHFVIMILFFCLNALGDIDNCHRNEESTNTIDDRIRDV